MAKKSRKSVPSSPVPSPLPAAPTESDTGSDEQSEEVEVRPPPTSKIMSLSASQGSDGDYDESDEKSDEIEEESDELEADPDGNEDAEDDAGPGPMNVHAAPSRKNSGSRTSPKSAPSRSTRVWSDQDVRALFSWLKTHVKNTGKYPLQMDYEAAGGGAVVFSDSSITWTRVYEKMRRLRATFWRNFLNGKLPTNPRDLKIYKRSKKIWGRKKDYKAGDNLEVEGGVPKKQKTVVVTGSDSGNALPKTEVHFPHLRHVVEEIGRREPSGLVVMSNLDGINLQKASVLEQKLIKLSKDQWKLKTREFDLYKKITALVWDAM